MSNTLDIVPELRDLIAAAEFMSKELVRVSRQRDELLDACRQVLAGRREKDEDEEMNGWRSMAAAVAKAGGQ